ncbi:MAG: hypothetical protein LBH90_03800, partial [Tannerella sp.]|nr:hypothetical protein [Tannerella sp.]
SLVAEDPERLAAHELGHGIFTLRHTFDVNLLGSDSKGQTANLMDYGHGTELAVWQWDVMANPAPLTWFDDEESSQLAILGGITWIGDILGGLVHDSQEKEIKNIQVLLDHVHENYQDYFEKSKSENINITEGEYKAWSIRTSSHSGKIAKSIYSKFNAKQDNTFNLHEKGIYTENYTLDEKTYRLAVYSVRESVDLKNDKVRLKGYRELANHTYVKAGYSRKYGIIVLYDDDKNFQMLLQISGDDTPEKVAEQWLNYLAIVVASDEQKEYDKSILDKILDKIGKLFTKEELPKIWDSASPDKFEIQLFEGNKLSGKDSVMLITAEPKMPDIRVKPFLQNYTGKEEVEMRLKIEYKKWNSSNTQIRDDSTYYPANEWKKVKANEVWDVDFGTDIRGGKVTVFCRTADTTISLVFYIRGANPSEQAVRNYLQTHNYNQWFLVKMIRQESGSRISGAEMKQFNDGTNYGKEWSSVAGCPNMGDPKGFGLMQLDNWGTADNPQSPTSQQLWNWQANLDGGQEVLAEKLAIVNRQRAKHDAMILLWNSEHMDNPVSDSLLIESGENTGTTVAVITEGSNGRTETFAVNPTGNQRSIYDATWIKLYNGGNLYHQMLLDTDKKPYRVIYRTISETNNSNYVGELCGKQN